MRLLYNSLKDRRDAGFTIVELLIITMVMALLTPIVLGSLYSFYTDNTTSIKQSTQDTDTRSVLRSIATELANATGFGAIQTVAGSPLGSGNGATDGSQWSYCGGSGGATCTQPVNRVLIAYTTTTDGPRDSSTRFPVYINDASACNISTAPAARNAQIYFVAADRNNPAQNNLYRRTLVNIGGGSLCSCTLTNPNPTGCVTPHQKQSCASTSVASNPSRCLSSDALLLRSVSVLNIDYYNASSLIASQYTSDIGAIATQIANATSVKISVEKNETGTNRKSTADIRVVRQ